MINTPSPLPTYYSSAKIPQPHRLIHLGLPSQLEQRHDAAQEREYTCTVQFSGRGSIGILRRSGERKLTSKQLLDRATKLVGIEYKYSDIDGNDKFALVQVKEDLPSPSYLVRSFDPSQRIEWLKDFAIRCQFRRQFDADVECQKSTRVAKGLTNRGKHILESGVAALVYKYGHRNLGFYTLTCPVNDTELIQSFNDNYPEIIRRFMQEVRRIYDRRGLVFNYVGCYEIQPDRYKRTGEQCLHFHYVAPCYDSDKRFVLHHSEICSLYRRVIERVVGIRLSVNPRVDATVVRSNAGGYLAKYISKAVSVDSESPSCKARASLSSWYSVSRSLLLAVKRLRLQLPGNISADIYGFTRRGEKHPWCSYQKAILKEINGEIRCVGIIFRLVPEILQVMREIVFPRVSHLL